MPPEYVIGASFTIPANTCVPSSSFTNWSLILNHKELLKSDPTNIDFSACKSKLPEGLNTFLIESVKSVIVLLRSCNIERPSKLALNPAVNLLSNLDLEFI